MGIIASLDKDYLFKKFSKSGSVQKKMTPSQVACIRRCAREFTRTIELNCDTHFLYRANISENDGILYIVMVGSDENGSITEVGMNYDLETGVLNILGNLEIKDKKAVGASLYNMVAQITVRVTRFAIGMLDIPLVGEYVSGSMAECRGEEGSYMIYIDHDDSLQKMVF